MTRVMQLNAMSTEAVLVEIRKAAREAHGAQMRGDADVVIEATVRIGILTEMVLEHFGIESDGSRRSP